MKYRYLKLINGYPCSYIVPQDSPIPNYKEIYGDECRELILEDNEYLQERYVVNNGTLKVCNEYDKYTYDGNNYVIPETHYFKKNETGIIIDILEKPLHDYLHPVWNGEHCIWLESATDVEVVNYDSSRVIDQITKQERELKTQISLSRATKDLKSYEKEKAGIDFKKEESYKFQQCGSDFLNHQVSFEEYEEAKLYMYQLIHNEDCVRPTVMYRYDGGDA